jgi:hypothetical protein
MLLTARAFQQWFRYVALLVFVSPLACAQPEDDGNEARTAFGKWVPVTRTIWEFGNLTMDEDAFSWGPCVDVPYRVARSTDRAVLIELVRSPPCRLVRETPFWLEVDGDYLVISWCQDPSEIEKPLLERSCSSGRLKKLSD